MTSTQAGRHDGTETDRHESRQPVGQIGKLSGRETGRELVRLAGGL